jgi:hypothetical protein
MQVRDALWIWGHEAGSHNGRYQLPGTSRMTPAEGAFYLGVPNMAMCVYADKPEPPFDQLAISFRPLKQVVWSIVGDSRSLRNDKETDLEEVLSVARRHPNITGASLDDFFHAPDASGSISRYSPRQLEQFHERLHSAARPLDLWVVHYQGNIGLPVGEHLAACDVVSLWAWDPQEIPRREEHLARIETLAPRARKVLGCYLWDYGNGKPMPPESTELQCRQGFALLKSGRIDGMIFCASCICDLNLEAVEWTRRWIDEVGGEGIGTIP